MAPANEECKNLLLEMAATCRSTFDVDHVTLPKLFCSSEDVDALLSCSFFICALYPAYCCLSLALEEILRNMIFADASDYGVDLAVARIFTNYQPGTRRWKELQYPNNRWLTCETKAAMNRPFQVVHVNLLNGELRVAGQPLGSLPDKIKNSKEFQRIFCDVRFLILPSNVPGMDFMALAVTSKCKVHFSLRDDTLVLRMQCNQIDDPVVLIPSSKLQGDLLPALIDGHVHWLNPFVKSIEICPLDQLWGESSEHWRINLTFRSSYIYRGQETLMDIRSPTWVMISKYFKCLDATSSNLIITTSETTKLTQELALSVTLPHYSLSFFVNEMEELESCDFKQMVYDEDQCAGTLFGLENILILWPTRTLVPRTLVPRRILVPIGELIMRGDHQVQINPPKSHSDARPDAEPLYHTYIVDTKLGCLVGNGGLASTEFLARLHAMTSWHRPDSLTGKTGVQAALCLLQSAGCRSIMKL
ncbi:hypothetical protein V8E55_008106, partial [Tylopilus felleus]